MAQSIIEKDGKVFVEASLVHMLHDKFGKDFTIEPAKRIDRIIVIWKDIKLLVDAEGNIHNKLGKLISLTHRLAFQHDHNTLDVPCLCKGMNRLFMHEISHGSDNPQYKKTMTGLNLYLPVNPFKKSIYVIITLDFVVKKITCIEDVENFAKSYDGEVSFHKQTQRLVVRWQKSIITFDKLGSFAEKYLFVNGNEYRCSVASQLNIAPYSLSE